VIYKKWSAAHNIKPRNVVRRQVIIYATQEHPFPISVETAEKIVDFFEQNAPSDPSDELTEELLHQLFEYMKQS
jgi:hypothetical protein